MSSKILAPLPSTVNTSRTSQTVGLLSRSPWSAELSLPSSLPAQAYVITRLPETRLRAGVVWFVPSTRYLDIASELLEFWGRQQGISLTYLKFPDDLGVWLTSHEQTHPCILLVAQEHVELALPSPQAITAATITLKKNQELKPFEFLRQLELAGYEPGPLPDSVGWFVRQGDHIVVSTAHQSYEITWQGNTIEELKPINLVSGLRSAPLRSLTLFPRRLPSDPKVTIATHLTPKLTLIGALTFLTPPALYRLPVNPLKPSQLIESVPLFGKQWDQLDTFIQARTSAGEQVIFLTAEPRRVAQLPIGSRSSLTVVDVPERTAVLLEGFKDKANRITYLTDREVVGAKRHYQRTSLAAFEHLEAGDYLVHIDHGIGRFIGLVSQPMDGIMRDYFTVEYAEEDKLYVPIEHTDRLSRYLGSPHPTLERLSAATWFQATKRARLEAERVARELVNTYAKRQVANVEPWQHHAEEAVLAASFPWPLTPDQLKAWAEISADLGGSQPMDRLVCGDVGFGKTELAVRAAYRAVLNKTQVAVLAPTTILAQQHFDTFAERMKKYGTRIGLVSRALEPASLRATLKQLAAGEIDVLIGTHRLLARDVHYPKLGLLIIDEEQRFGVKQKESLRHLRPELHVLTLSATPIPRTLHLAVSAIRDLSLITTPPVGRQSVAMTFAPQDDNILTRAIKQELSRQGQVYYLVNHISDLAPAEALLKRLFPSLRVGVVHGRLKPTDVAATMHTFDERKLDVLLATTIIENGLDLPNVNTLIVESAEQFGLADLYQLKGRVGRTTTKAYAYFLINDTQTIAAQKRLEALQQAEAVGSGLTLALKDLELRGAGAILGHEQHGHVSAIGLHLYGQLLAQAVEELQSGQSIPSIPEVRLRLPLEGRLHPNLIPNMEHRIQMYQRLAAIHDPRELAPTAEELIGRPLGGEPIDRLVKNLLTLLELKLMAERARLQEVSCQVHASQGKFSLRFLEQPTPEVTTRLLEFDDRWHKVESTWQAEHPLAAGAWIPWLKESLRVLEN